MQNFVNDFLRNLVGVWVCLYLFQPAVILAEVFEDPSLMSDGFAPISHVGVHNFQTYVLPKDQEQQKIEVFCQKLSLRYKDFGWKENPCLGVEWRADFISSDGHPLLYAVFGEGEDVTLFLGGVHPDELTPMHMAFQMGQHLATQKDFLENKKVRVVVAPLVSPDGFLRSKLTRTNGFVDVNRNFLTLDWYDRAHQAWLGKKWQKRARYFPGFFPNTEIETLFQVHLIEEYHPDKLINIHAPLGFLDYDGPGDRRSRSMRTGEKRALELVHVIAKESRNYRVVDYSIYPGSLGNYAGHERGLPTVTLELESTDPRFVEKYWKKFSPGLMQSIQFPFKSRKKEDRLNRNLEAKGSYLHQWMKTLDQKPVFELVPSDHSSQ
ncbi:MAG: M14 family zinc carboxypeptidase [Oligoflexales bacterium]